MSLYGKIVFTTKLLNNGILKKSLINFSVARLMSNVRKHAVDQMEYLKKVTDETPEDWTKVKKETLSIPGSLNEKNLDSVLLKYMVNKKKFDAALSFAEHLKKDTNLTIGSINSLLLLYYELGPDKITDKEKSFIIESYTNLYTKYKLLDSTTCERLLHALCVINEWKKAVKVFEDIYLSGKPTHSAYSNIIAMFFKLNKKADAMKYVERSLNDNRPLTFVAYKEWIDYILGKYKDKKTILKYLEEMLFYISRNCLVVNAETAEKIKNTYTSLGWNAQYTKIMKKNGQCLCCKESLECLKLTNEEFELLQQNVKEKLIIGSDVLLKSSDNELNRFSKFIQDTAPFDIVLDALNIAYTNEKNDRVNVLQFVVNYFLQKDKKVLLLGRKHMMGWPKIKRVLSLVDHFFIENISQDDPYFITAAIFSGPHTDIVSKDLLRGHKFNLQNEKLRFIFQKWQWQHQWKVFIDRHSGRPFVVPPLPITPIAQNKGSSWHLPFEREDLSTAGLVKDGVPDWNSWLCVRPAKIKELV